MDKGDEEYAELLKQWGQLREEKENGGGRTQGGTLGKLWSSSNDHSEKAAVAKALHSASKSVEQLSANVVRRSVHEDTAEGREACSHPVRKEQSKNGTEHVFVVMCCCCPSRRS